MRYDIGKPNQMCLNCDVKQRSLCSAHAECEMHDWRRTIPAEYKPMGNINPYAYLYALECGCHNYALFGAENTGRIKTCKCCKRKFEYKTKLTFEPYAGSFKALWVPTQFNSIDEYVCSPLCWLKRVNYHFGKAQKCRGCPRFCTIRCTQIHHIARAIDYKLMNIRHYTQEGAE